MKRCKRFVLLLLVVSFILNVISTCYCDAWDDFLAKNEEMKRKAKIIEENNEKERLEREKREEEEWEEFQKSLEEEDHWWDGGYYDEEEDMYMIDLSKSYDITEEDYGNYIGSRLSDYNNIVPFYYKWKNYDQKELEEYKSIINNYISQLQVVNHSVYKNDLNLLVNKEGTLYKYTSSSGISLEGKLLQMGDSSIYFNQYGMGRVIPDDYFRMLDETMNTSPTRIYCLARPWLYCSYTMLFIIHMFIDDREVRTSVAQKLIGAISPSCNVYNLCLHIEQECKMANETEYSIGANLAILAETIDKVADVICNNYNIEDIVNKLIY